MDFNRKEMEESGWTFTKDGVGIPPSALKLVREYADKDRREPMQQEIIQAIVDSMPIYDAPTDAIQVIGADPSMNNTGLAWVTYWPMDGWNIETGAVKCKSEEPVQDRLQRVAYAVYDFCGGLLSPTTGIVEGHYWSSASEISPTSIQTYCEAVGACYGVISTVCKPIRVDPDWMPRILCGRVKGGTTKEDRHAIAEALLQRAGSTAWPSEASEHEKDALCLCVAYLVEEGWL